MISVHVDQEKNIKNVVESSEKKMNEFEIKVHTGYENNLFFKENGELNITENIETLSMYPVRIELKKYTEESKLIGTIYGYYFDIDFMENEKIPLFEIFDSISQEIYDLYEVLFKDNDYREEYEVFNPNLFYLSDIWVENEYRQEGYAKMLLDKLDQILRYVAKLNVGVIATELYSKDAVDNIVDVDLTNEEKIEIIDKVKNILLDNDYMVSNQNDNYLIKVVY